MNTLARTLIVAALIAATGAASAGPRGLGPPPRHHHHHHGGFGYGGLAFGLALTVPLFALANQADRGPTVIYVPEPTPQPAPTYAPSPPAPVIYSRNGQDTAQLEADQRECNRWATTQPAAMADASVFHRSVEACMDARGYTLR